MATSEESLSSTLKMEIVDSLKMLEPIYQATQYDIPEDLALTTMDISNLPKLVMFTIICDMTPSIQKH